MFRFFPILLILFSLIFLAGCAKKEKTDVLGEIKKRNEIIVGTKFDSKQFSFMEKGELQGFDIDFSREIARRIFGDSDAVEFRKVTTSDRIFKLTSKEVDMVVATMTITPQRQKVVEFSDPYYTSGLAIMVRTGSEIRFAQDLEEKKVAVVTGSTAERHIEKLIPKAIVQGFPNYESAYYALKDGKVDAMVSDDAILAGFLMYDLDVEILSGRYTKEFYGVAFRKGKQSERLKEAVNMAIEDMKADGTLKALKEKWIPDFYVADTFVDEENKAELEKEIDIYIDDKTGEIVEKEVESDAPDITENTIDEFQE